MWKGGEGNEHQRNQLRYIVSTFFFTTGYFCKKTNNTEKEKYVNIPEAIFY